jgi:pimeloyl-ACP methyl ester carboxylesterase
VLERLEMPAGTMVSGLESDGGERSFCGGGKSGRVRAVREEDWRIMSLPGRLETQHALVLDYRRHVARFGEIGDYLARRQPPALLLWGRHDGFFEIDETLAWMKALPRMEAHILDGPHLLLETHSAECAELMSRFVGAARPGSLPGSGP